MRALAHLMRNSTPLPSKSRSVLTKAALALSLVLAAWPHPSPAALWDLATSPIETSAGSSVKPNIMFILDDSGSMSWDFMPDWVNSYRTDESLVRNSGFNGVYYNPAITYAPPLNYDGTPRLNMTSANTVGWTKVPFDAYGIQIEGSNNTTTPNIITFPNSSSGKTWQNLVGNARYYTFVAGEYCTESNLRTCIQQSAPSATHPYPANLRWCQNSTLTDCQASNIDGTYVYPKYPGTGGVEAQSATARLTLTAQGLGLGTKSVSSIKVNGQEILSSSRNGGTLNTYGTLATNLVNGINACTTAKTGACTVSGFSASSSLNFLLQYVITITAPESMGNITFTPVVTDSSAINTNPTSFSGGVDAVPALGDNVRTSITSGNTYPKAATRTDCAGTVCTYDEEMTNFANWWAYYHTRMQTAKSGITTAFAALENKYRLGYMSINNASGSDFLNISDLTTASGGQKNQWFNKVANAKPSGGTPLRRALSNAGRIYAGKVSSYAGITVTDPMQYACQRNVTLLSTDGYWNKFRTDLPATGPGYKIDGTTAVGNQDGSETGAAKDGLNISDTLADVAQYYYSTDIRSGTFTNTTGSLGTDVASNDVGDGQQRMYTFTLGLGASGVMQYDPKYEQATSGDFFDVKSGLLTSTSTQSAGRCVWQTSGNCTWPSPVGDTQTTIDDLWHAAVNGRGKYYSAKDPVTLRTSLTEFLNDLDAQLSSSAAATTSNPNISSGDNYVFKSTFTSLQWSGELARYQLDPSTGALSANADWSQSGTVFANASTKTPTPALLDNRNHTTRLIYTFNPVTRSRIDFTWSALDTANLEQYFQIAHIRSATAPLGPLSQLCSTGSNCLASDKQVDTTTSGIDTGAGGINLVNFLRGDRSNEGTDASTHYRERAHVLGDIVDSQAVYVKGPLWSYTDPGYSAFKANNANRQGMVYVGANDGMLHAFNADNGAEAWAYIPAMLLPNLYKLADKNYASNHQYYVNATPKAGDVYLPGSDGGLGTWKTILVGGLGRGGRGYYALDITNPASPSVLWEFGVANDADVGYTYGTPIITKLSDGTWSVIVTSGYNNVNPGSGKGIVWILNAHTGAVIKKIDTGMGSAAGTITGCSAAPCPSGLSKISAFVEAASLNEQAKRIYGGDLYGNVWRIDISQLTAAGGTAYVQLLATLSSDVNGIDRQPITTRPEVGFIESRPVIYVGTGAYLGQPDTTNTKTQTIYALKDPVAINESAAALAAASSATTPTYNNPKTQTCTSTSKTNCFIRHALTDTAGVRSINTSASTAVSYEVNFATMNGWYADMPQSGERIDTDPVLQLGTLAFTSNKPITNNSCASGGSSYINFFNFKSGKSVKNNNVVGESLSSGTTSTLATAVTLVRLPDGKVVGVVNLSDGSTKTKETPVVGAAQGTRRITWRELIN